jgi:hypothetical protein
MFPAAEWPRNFIGFHDDYDPRMRPWYIAATSGPKNVVIIIDGSSSMKKNGRWEKTQFPYTYIFIFPFEMNE